MKKILMILSLVGVALLGSCSFDHGDFKVNPGISFSQNGLLTVNTISIYSSQVQNITIARTTGVSKEFTMKVGIDQTLIDNYNEIYGTDYQLMPANIYSFPEELTYVQFEKNVVIPVTFNTAALVAQVGLANAGKYIIPIKLTDTSIDADFAPSKTQVLIVLNVIEPSITVADGQSAKLEFIADVPLTQTETLEATANFTTLDVTKVTYAADASKVAEFNAAHSTSHVILPVGTYTVNTGVFDAATKKLTTDVVFNCSALDFTKTYLLPLVMTNTANYQMVQEEVVYVEVTITELWLTVVNGGQLVTTTSGTGNLRVNINAPIADPQPVVFQVDEAAIAAYNTAHSTSLVAYPSNKVTINPSAIAVGSLYVNVPYTIDISALEYDTPDEYAIAFTLQQASLVSGTNINGSTTVVVKIKKTVVGWYDKATFTTDSYYFGQVPAGQSNGDFSGTIQNANVILNVPTIPAWPGNDSDMMGYAVARDDGHPSATATSDGKPLGKYGIYTYAMGGGNYIFFDITNRPSALKGAPWVELDMYMYSWYDGIYEHKSAFNPNTGEFYFDWLGFSYWNDPTRFSVKFTNRRDNQ